MKDAELEQVKLEEQVYAVEIRQVNKFGDQVYALDKGNKYNSRKETYTY